MEPTETQTQAAVDDGGFQWFGEPTGGAPRELKDEPPLGTLHEDDWAWLLSYKFDEWAELTLHSDRQGHTPKEISELKHRKRTFEFVQSMYDQRLTPEEWTSPMPPAADRYVELYKQCSDDQKAYLEDVATGVITPSFPDPTDEAEEHRGKPRQWS